MGIATRAGMLSPIQEYLQQLHARYIHDTSGHVADYIPELSKADPNWFGICIATRDGHVYEIGETRQAFTIQSISKALAYGLALEDRGEDHVLARIGVEPSGEAFNAISLKEGTGSPFNPMINAGAIATCGQVLKKDGKSRIQRITEYLSGFAGRELTVNQTVYESESSTGHRNRAIGWLLRNFGIVDEDPHDTLETYFQQCSLEVTCRDLALMGATLANQGVHPQTGRRAIAAEYVDNVLGVMATCGMYDWSGEWIYRVGLPAKSGVGGGILAVLPGQLGIAVFSPPLDSQGNSHRGIKVCMDLARELSLHMLNPTATPRSAARISYHGAEVLARRRLPPSARELLKRHGQCIRVIELQGGLIVSTIEPVLRYAAELASSVCRHLIFDLRAVVSANAVSVSLLASLSMRLSQQGIRVLFCQPGRMLVSLRSVGISLGQIFSTLDAALENCEDSLLLEVTGASWRPAGRMELQGCSLFRGCSADDIAFIRQDLQIRSYKGGETLITTGHMAEEMMVLLKGSVEVQIRVDGMAQRVDVLTAGMTVGEMAFVDGTARSADVVAQESVDCLIITRPWFESLAERRPLLKIHILQEMMRETAARLRQANLETATLQRS